jgi:serine/threonine protein kinase/predicted Zn-dependent protease
VLSFRQAAEKGTTAMKCPKCHFDNPSDSGFCSKCGTQIQPSSADISISQTETLQTPIKELTTGSTFAGRYQVIEELGKGGMGRVYKVFDTDIKEKVALKLLKPEIASDRETIERFSNELKYARKISHRNVCRMYDLGKAEGTHFITMEYVSGEDLKTVIRMTGSLTIGATLSIGKQVCDGLAEAHSLGVVHRDLKPQNIMIDKGGNAKIMDFGIARSIREKGITGPSVMIGTPEYMSPEQAEAKEVDHRSDIYSLGIILYEMATGRVPFEGDTALSIAMKHKGEIPKDPKQFNPNIPDDLSGVILKCLEKDKAKRYQAAAEVRSELEKIEKGIPTTERVVPERKTLTSREITVKFTLRKLFIPALIFVALIVIGAILWRIVPSKKAVLPLSGKPTLAVLYFKNNTGDEKLEIWRSGLSDLLISALSQSKYINVLSSDQVFSLLKRLNLLEAKSYASEDLKKVASDGGATHILQGYYTRAGDNFRINITLQKAETGEIVGSENAEGPGERSFFPMVDELIRKVKANFQLSSEQLATDLEKEVQKIITSSPEAYKYYVESRKYHYSIEYRKCIPLLEKAIALDLEFAMAYRALGSAYNNLGDMSKHKVYIKKAVELSDRLSDRERYFIQGNINFYNAPERDWNKAIEAYNRVLELYPDDPMVNYELGYIYMLLEEWDKSIQYFEVCRKNKYTFLAIYAHLADVYRAKGFYDKAGEVLEYCIENISDSARTHLYMAYNYYLAQAKLDSALAEVDKAITRDPTFPFNSFHYARILMYKGDLAKARLEFMKSLEEREINVLYNNYLGLFALDLLEGKFEKAKTEVGQAIDKMNKLGAKNYEAEFHIRLAYGYLNSGRPEKALEECEKGRKLALEIENDEWQRRALYLKGLSYLRKGSMDEAQKTAEELKQMIQSGINKKKIRFYTHLAGVIELERKNYPKAIEYLRNAVELLPYGPLDKDASFIDSLALAYYKSGDLEKARETYENITSLTLGRFSYGDIFAKSFYMLGKIYEQKGQKEKAIENYTKFLDLWKDADPGLPEFEDAKKRLSSL